MVHSKGYTRIMLVLCRSRSVHACVGEAVHAMAHCNDLKSNIFTRYCYLPVFFV
jgi:hypothetical protein